MTVIMGIEMIILITLIEATVLILAFRWGIKYAEKKAKQ